MTEMRGFRGEFRSYGYIYYDDMTVEYHLEQRGSPDGLTWQMADCIIHVGDARFNHDYGAMPKHIQDDIWKCHEENTW